jgi:Mrp family chromosome partitioning ATPase
MKQKDIKNYLLVLSGKGGVGKSTVAANLAVVFAQKGLKVGLLDADIHGPNLALMLGVQEKAIFSCGEDFILPVEVSKNLSLVSIAYFIPKPDTPIIWRGPAKMKIIEKFVKETSWGKLDWLIIDAPPGTGDEPLSIAQLLPEAGAVIVTTPQDVSLLDSKKAINFSKELKLKIHGIIENMSGLKCPHCGKMINLFKKGGGLKISKQYKIPFLGTIPIDPEIVISGDSGNPLTANNNSGAAKIFLSIADKIRESC